MVVTTSKDAAIAHLKKDVVFNQRSSSRKGEGNPRQRPKEVTKPEDVAAAGLACTDAGDATATPAPAQPAGTPVARLPCHAAHLATKGTAAAPQRSGHAAWLRRQGGSRPPRPRLLRRAAGRRCYQPLPSRSACRAGPAAPPLLAAEPPPPPSRLTPTPRRGARSGCGMARSSIGGAGSAVSPHRPAVTTSGRGGGLHRLHPVHVAPGWETPRRERASSPPSLLAAGFAAGKLR
ncbi:hypothetical protein OsI_12752 [Oryza sativa Indica Group]|uniref:Uncharacterized protein n=1 Tax=Oryza sativa subsp. indica TaxID=39946 RepID=B8AN36_ORYSI|nr:hypothetical protein OsI_12752 [Oryza sativa Indica Group]